MIEVKGYRILNIGSSFIYYAWYDTGKMRVDAEGYKLSITVDLKIVTIKTVLE